MLLRHLSWELVAAWAVVGVISGVALSEIFTRLVLLLVPAVIVAAWLLWNFDATRDVGAGLVGLSVGPLLLAKQALNPPCPALGEFAVCGSEPVWPWLAAAALLVLVGAAVLVVPRSSHRSQLSLEAP